MKRLVAAGSLVLVASALAAAPSATGKDCAAAWGSNVDKRSGHTSRQLVEVRAGRHACFDRLVVDVNGLGAGRLGFRVKYVDQVTADGSGAVVPLRGGARLQVVVHAPAYDGSGEATYHPGDASELVNVDGFDTFRQVASGGSFEGDTLLGLGVRARLPMRAFVLRSDDGSARVVVDVAHHW